MQWSDPPPLPLATKVSFIFQEQKELLLFFFFFKAAQCSTVCVYHVYQGLFTQTATVSLWYWSCLLRCDVVSYRTLETSGKSATQMWAWWSLGAECHMAEGFMRKEPSVPVLGDAGKGSVLSTACGQGLKHSQWMLQERASQGGPRSRSHPDLKCLDYSMMAT